MLRYVDLLATTCNYVSSIKSNAKIVDSSWTSTAAAALLRLLHYEADFLCSNSLFLLLLGCNASKNARRAIKAEAAAG